MNRTERIYLPMNLFWHLFYAVSYTFKLEKMFNILHDYCLHHRTSRLCFKLSNLLLLALHGWPRPPPPFFLKLHFSTCKYINRSSKRKRDMASNPLFIIPDFFCIFPMNSAIATLGLKGFPHFRQTTPYLFPTKPCC